LHSVTTFYHHIVSSVFISLDITGAMLTNSLWTDAVCSCIVLVLCHKCLLPLQALRYFKRYFILWLVQGCILDSIKASMLGNSVPAVDGKLRYLSQVFVY